MKYTLALVVLAATLWGTSGVANTITGPYHEATARDAWRQVSAIEKMNDIPRGLLHAMALVETGQGLEGVMLPWPYTVGINPTPTRTFNTAASALNQLDIWSSQGFARYDVTINGQKYTRQTLTRAQQRVSADGVKTVKLKACQIGRRFESADEAARYAQTLVRNGNRNLDIGLMQVNWRYHSSGFTGLREAFDPVANATYAVSYLRKHKETRDWWHSVGRYHSGTKKHAHSYIQRVYAMYRKVHRLPSTS